jgi:hypothetical protein
MEDQDLMQAFKAPDNLDKYFPDVIFFEESVVFLMVANGLKQIP